MNEKNLIEAPGFGNHAVRLARYLAEMVMCTGELGDFYLYVGGRRLKFPVGPSSTTEDIAKDLKTALDEFEQKGWLCPEKEPEKEAYTSSFPLLRGLL